MITDGNDDGNDDSNDGYDDDGVDDDDDDDDDDADDDNNDITGGCELILPSFFSWFVFCRISVTTVLLFPT